MTARRRNREPVVLSIAGCALMLLACAVGCVTEPAAPPTSGEGWNVSISADPSPAAPTLSPVAPPSDGPHLTPIGPRDTGFADDGEYRIGPDDLLEVSVVGEPEITGMALRVSSRGFVDIPYAGSLQAAGLTVDEFRRVLEVKLDEFYVRPQVVVSLREYRSRMVHLLGEVSRPGPFKLTHGNTLMEVVSRAGGFTPLADLSDVQIIRTGGGGKRVIRIDVNDIMDEGRMDLDPLLEAGDVIRVPERLL